MTWYKKYLAVYEKPFNEAPQAVIEVIKENIRHLQSDHPLVSVVVIAYNEEKHLLANLWSLSDTQCKYPLEIIGKKRGTYGKRETSDVFAETADCFLCGPQKSAESG